MLRPMNHHMAKVACIPCTYEAGNCCSNKACPYNAAGLPSSSLLNPQWCATPLEACQLRYGMVASRRRQLGSKITCRHRAPFIFASSAWYACSQSAVHQCSNAAIREETHSLKERQRRSLLVIISMMGHALTRRLNKMYCMRWLTGQREGSLCSAKA